MLYEVDCKRVTKGAENFGMSFFPHVLYRCVDMIADTAQNSREPTLPPKTVVKTRAPIPP